VPPLFDRRFVGELALLELNACLVRAFGGQPDLDDATLGGVEAGGAVLLGGPEGEGAGVKPAVTLRTDQQSFIKAGQG